MDMLLWNVLTKYHHQAHQPATEVTPPVGIIGPSLGIIATPDILTVIIKIGTGSVVPDPTHITMDIGVAPHKCHKQHYKPAQGSSSGSQATPWKNKDRKHKQVTIDDPPSEYYSSDDQDSDSKDDLN